MRRFRYRTAALTGPWRDSVKEAMHDAARAKQAVFEEELPERIRWIVPGRIEEQNREGAEPRRLRS